MPQFYSYLLVVKTVAELEAKITAGDEIHCPVLLLGM